MEQLTHKAVLADLKAELGKRSAGYRTLLSYRRLIETESSETLRSVDLAIFTLEDAASMNVFSITVRTKILSDPSPEQVIKVPWTVGTLDDAARTICDLLEVRA